MTFKKLRRKSGLTQRQFAAKLKVHGQFLSNIEREVAPLPAKHFLAVAALCEVPVSTLVNMAVRDYKRTLIEKVAARK
jgi:transcriptional regulator with XRE-family HTH domain